MSAARIAARGRLRRGLPVTAVLGLGTAVALGGGPGQARAAAVPGAHAPVAGAISTVAGGVGGPAKATRVSLRTGILGGWPCGVSFAGGQVYITDGGSVREVNPTTDKLTTLAGTGSVGPLGDGGPAASAYLLACRGFNGPGAGAITADHSANLLIADTLNSRIRVVPPRGGTFYGQSMTAGDIYTIAGTGAFGFSGDRGPATAAELNGPQSVAVDRYGNLVIADTSNDRIRVVANRTGTFYSQSMTAGDIYTIAGTGTAGFSGDGAPAAKAKLNLPDQVRVDSAGNLVIADTGNNRIRVMATTAGTFYGKPMTNGDIYTVAGTGAAGFSGDRGPATAAELNDAQGVTTDSAGNLLIADTGNERVRVVAVSTGSFYGQSMTARDIYTIAGTGITGFSGDTGAATAARLDQPDSVSVDSSGNVLIADTLSGRVRAVAASTGSFYALPMTAGDIYTIAGASTAQFSGDRGPATAAELKYTAAVSVDSAGDLLITDTDNDRIRVAAARTGTLYGQSVIAGDIYTVAGGGQGGLADGGPATAAELSGPLGVAADSTGNLLIADSAHNRIRVVAAATGSFYSQSMTAGDIYTIAGTGTVGFSGDDGPATAAKLAEPATVEADSAGNLVIADLTNDRIRVVAAATGSFYGQSMTAGNIYTIAGTGTFGFTGNGGPAAKAEVADPLGMTFDSAGNLIVADSGNNRIRVVAAATGSFYSQSMTAGHIYTIAGTGTAGFSGDRGPATSARLDDPLGVAADASGNLLIADSGNNRVRVVAHQTGTFYGQSMTAGDIYMIAGTGVAGFTGDGGPAATAELNDPLGVAVDAAGDLLIADTGDNRIREIAG